VKRNRLNQQQECALLNKLGEICQAVGIDRTRTGTYRTRNRNIHTETDRTRNSEVTYSSQQQGTDRTRNKKNQDRDIHTVTRYRNK
jgi:hypothetical protein